MGTLLYAYWVSSDNSAALSIFRSVIDEKFLSIDGIEPGSIIEVSVIPEPIHGTVNHLIFTASLFGYFKAA